MRTTFVFLHGSFHAAWNWHKVVPLVDKRGHRGLALDLPAHGLDATTPRAATLDAAVDKVLAIVDAEVDPVILVAHSRNGIVISKAAELRPEKIAGLVYLAAYLVPNGKSMMDYAVDDTESLVVRNLEPPFDERRVRLLLRLCRNRFLRWLLPRILPASLQSHALVRSAYREALYHDCAPEITELAQTLLEPEPNWSGFVPMRLSPERYGRVPKVYVQCLQDRAVTPMLQRKMCADTTCDRVIALDAGHSPFFSQPDALVDALEECRALFAGR
ncbi:MAG: hypothetical protein JWN44_1723 [Myxococcales bacterium]|nr:hypothetical protein [Myxococcales bacterium]